jgi:hypothetical protein
MESHFGDYQLSNATIVHLLCVGGAIEVWMLGQKLVNVIGTTSFLPP